MAASGKRNQPYHNEARIIAQLASKGWVSLSKFAKLVGLSYPTAHRMANADPPQIKTIPVGGVRRVYHDEIRRFLVEGNLRDVGDSSPASQPQVSPELQEALDTHGKDESD